MNMCLKPQLSEKNYPSWASLVFIACGSAPPSPHSTLGPFRKSNAAFSSQKTKPNNSWDTWGEILAFLSSSLQSIHMLEPLSLWFPRLHDALSLHTKSPPSALAWFRRLCFYYVTSCPWHEAPYEKPLSNYFLEISVPVEELICFLLSDKKSVGTQCFVFCPGCQEAQNQISGSITAPMTTLKIIIVVVVFLSWGIWICWVN